MSPDIRHQRKLELFPSSGPVKLVAKIMFELIPGANAGNKLW